jgi:phospholipid transport system substrate-binding protein
MAGRAGIAISRKGLCPMSMKNTLAVALIALITLGVATHVFAGPPTEQLRAYTDAVQKVLDDPALKAPDKRQERRSAVRKVASEVFDVQETARRALGPHWQKLSPSEREEFVQVFADLLERTYISKIDLYGGEKLQYTAEQVEGNRAVVRAKVITRQGTEVPVEARMLKSAGNDRWLIYDVAIENISLIGNYRAQFDQIIRKESFAELLNRLKTKRDDFLDESGQAKPKKS